MPTGGVGGGCEPAVVVKRRETVFTRRLPRWYRRHGQDLPWRRTRAPYRIPVSEVMLR
ncbi:MAG: hypothetical protein QN152_09305 [Armatimonadota bacterium]|nr:hypothetical protein [Armatimonadota bacterium]MDR7426104.1 hypothetical protein [Armatimonadota bacterium]MDR7465615.1 hypothetical protein [Armatimonadota bacterium]MDR7469103.1 hypothetical protein [Armatimonadota bacterium]MDR7539708.1 hypothetical protein [Armatimonadota bacterium]